MYDLMALAYEADLTRVVTYMKSRDASQRVYPEDRRHRAAPCDVASRQQPGEAGHLVKVNTHHMALFAKFIEKLASTPDGDGSLLDHSLILYGSGMSESDTHSRINIPTLLVGKGAGMVKGHQHVAAPKETPMANFLLDLANKFGSTQTTFGISTEASRGLAEAETDMRKLWILAFVAVAALPASAATPIIDAVKGRAIRPGLRAALQKRADVNAAEADGMTALHWAARNNDLAAARALVRAGANVKDGEPLRHHAAHLAAQKRQRGDAGAAPQAPAPTRRRRCPRGSPC
jgi:hypothetical protein